MAGRTLRKHEVSYFLSVPKEERDEKWETEVILRLKRLIKRTALLSYEAYEGSRRDILDLDDFESAAYLGALKAIRAYEPSLGGFNDYVVLCIQGAIKRNLVEKRGRNEYVIIPLDEVGVIPTDVGIEEAHEMACWSSTAYYIFKRFKALLTPKEYEVLYELFTPGGPASTEVEVAHKLGMSRGNVQILKYRGLEKITRCLSTTIQNWDY